MRLELSEIYKSFGNKPILKGIGFSAQSGSAYGLLGRNGAGKTTTIRIVMNVFPADYGTVTVDGVPIHQSGVKIGYLPEERGMYAKKRIDEQLVFFGMLKGMDKKSAYESAKKLVARFDLAESFEKKLMTLSKGNQQKIQLAATLIDDPDIIILDEPFSGLDPVNARVLKDVINENISKGKIVLFSSHQMNYIEEFCENLSILRDGEIVLSGNLNDIKKSSGSKKLIVRSDKVSDISKLILGNSRLGITMVSSSDDKLILEMSDICQKDELLKSIVSAGISIDEFSVQYPTLEEIFVEVTKQ